MFLMEWRTIAPFALAGGGAQNVTPEGYALFMNEITKRYLDKYREQIEWELLTKSVLCEIATAQISVMLEPLIALADSSQPMPAPMLGITKAKIEALITLSGEITALGLELMLNE